MITIDIEKKDYPSFDALKKTLIDNNYERVTMLMKPGEFCVRGGIIDIFSYDHSLPLRLEYFGNELDRVCSFSIATQRSVTSLTSTTIHKEPSTSMPFFEFIDVPKNENLFNQLQHGDFVVHETFGIGIYKGLKHLTVCGRDGDFIHIQYQGEDKVYVPFEQMNLVHKYTNADSPKIGKLHDGSWKKNIQKAEKQIIQLAKEVVMTFKIRQSKPGFPFQEDTENQIDFEQEFEFKETRDQLLSIDQVKKDMESTAPMERLICGDVGYGKTEIVLRAAFKAVENNKQVAIIAPTTLLVDQHYQTFKKRFINFPYKIGILSRMQPKKNQKITIEKLKEDKINIIIGTHRLLQKDIEFSNLGLLVIDEEQRFGVTHKEKIKYKHPLVDFLSISATPIPRTLYMALSGARDLSLIKTPPTNRKPVLTYVAPYKNDIVKQAVKKELERNGQIFYLYNNVQTMDAKLVKLKHTFPDLSIQMAHGQMNEKDLKQIFTDFKTGKTNILLCSTIIESGIDLPNANTIIVEKTEYLGLSQIHQLRGRVGRSNRQSFAYLLFNPEKITDKGKNRLTAIQAYAALGSGYQLALKDLEIRGSGTLLGNKQHGHMTSIGFELYCKLLETAVENITHSKKEVKKRPVRFAADIMTYFPTNYIPCENERLSIYQRLLSFKYRDEIEDLFNEMEDRFGRLPELILSFLRCIQSQLQKR
jgi:transcription-repair coupling factor (superfamily II helicase)